jgi:protein phosphatase PTC1
MKEFVVGAPYTTETTLDDDDEFLIVACDGVRNPACSMVERLG